MTYDLRFSEFTAGEAAHITGISQDEQRDWRKRGFLPPVDGGKAKFNVKSLAQMMVAKRLNNLGIGPQTGWELARSCGTMIFARLMNARIGVDDPEGLAAGRLVQIAPGSEAEYRWVITEDGKSWARANSAADIAEFIYGAAVVLDLDDLAGRLSTRAGRPLVSVVGERA